MHIAMILYTEINACTVKEDSKVNVMATFAYKSKDSKKFKSFKWIV